MATYTYTNANSIFDGGDFFDVPQTIVVNLEAYVLNFTSSLAPNNYDAGLVLFNGSYTVTVNGVVGTNVVSATAHGIQFSGPTGLSKLTIGAAGVVFGTETGVAAFHATNITNAGYIESAVDGIYQGGLGNWTITNSAGGEIVSLGNGININNGGTHTIVNKGLIYVDTGWGILAQGGGIEKVTNSGVIDGPVDLGNNNDSFTNTGFVLNGDIFMGTGDDIFTGGNSFESVWDEAGKDTYKLGGGNDEFFATGLGAGDSNIDTIDGGAGIDWYDASDAINPLSINLDTKNQFDPVFVQTNVAKTATDKGAGEIGNDQLSNIENIDGGKNADSIFGSAVGNEIWGNNGNDNLFGLAGNDVLNGNLGIDDLFGGLGRDLLAGNVDGLNDGEIDTFHYTSLKDSTAAVTGRDIILSFEDGFDKIDLSAINATIGNNMFFIGTNTTFGQTIPGDLRVLTTGSGWLVQLDANIDGKVDFAIEVRDIPHAIVWDANDFILV